MNGTEFKNVKVERVRFSGNNFSIFTGSFDGTKETFVGGLIVAQGERYNFVGQTVIDKTYGKQIKFTNFEKLNIVDVSDLKEYFKSFKGIGEAKAKKIVDTFGEDSIKVIKENHLKLVPLGIKESVAHDMYCSLSKNEVLNEMVQKLSKYSISLSTINKIYDMYKDESLDVLKYNPYKIKDHFNVAFATLDQFSLNEGIETANLSRVIGGIKESMNYFLALGNTVAFASDIVSETQKKLNAKEKDTNKQVTTADIIKVLAYLNDEKELIVQNDGAIFLPYYYYAERNIARKILKMNKKCYENVLTRPFEELMKEVEKEVGITYSPNQQDAIRTALTSPICIITGGPGTGKTTTVNGAIHAIKLNNPTVRLELAAPTGKAAKRMEESTGMKAKTMHRLLEMKPFNGELKCERNEENPIDTDDLFIDESSMIDTSLMEKFLRALKEGTRMILVGDCDQLPSVGPGKVLRDLIDSKVIPVIKLDTIYRQQGTSTIVLNANNINKGLGLHLENDDFLLKEINDDDSVVAQEIVKDFVAAINSGKYTLDEVQVLCPMKKRENLAGSLVLNKMLQDAINPKKQGVFDVTFGFTSYREGDKVIQTKNNGDKDCFNGDVGYIKSIFKKDGDINAVVKFDEEKEVTFVGREEILELELAYSMSVHKSQGSEYPLVLLPMVLSQEILLTRNVLYTGITRAKKVVKLYGSKQAVSKCIKNNKTTKRHTKLAEYLTTTTINFN